MLSYLVYLSVSASYYSVLGFFTLLAKWKSPTPSSCVYWRCDVACFRYSRSDLTQHFFFFFFFGKNTDREILSFNTFGLTLWHSYFILFYYRWIKHEQGLIGNDK